LYAATSSIYNFTSSANLRIGSLEQYTQSLNTRSASFACVTATNNFACTQYFSNASNAVSFTSTGSLYSDGGMRLTKDLYVSGTAFFNNVTVFGTQSVAYISSSQLNIGTNIISVNTDTPSIRFGGLAVYDSGSTGLTGSMLWDSEDNQWIYSNPSGSAYDSAVFLVGPRNVGVLGNELGISCNFLSKGNGMHHMTSSGIFEDGSRTCFYNNSFISSSGAACFAGSLTGTSATFSGLLDVNFNSGVRIRNGATDGFQFLQLNTNTWALRGLLGNDNITFTNGTGAISVGGVACFASQICAQGATFTTTGNTAVTIASGATGLSRLVFQGTVGNSRGFIDYDNSTCGFIIRTNENEALRITCTGNLGLGITPSAWSAITALELGNGVSFSSFTAAAIPNGYITNNAFYNGSNWIYKVSSYPATMVTQTSGGNYAWNTAPIGTANQPITFTQAMTLNASGNLGLGTTSLQATYRVTISGTDTIFPSIYLENTTNSQAYSIRATGTNFVVRDNTSGNDRITLTSAANVGIGTASPTERLQVGGFNSNNHIRINGFTGTQNANLGSIKFFNSISTEFEIARVQSGVGSTNVNDGYLSFFTGNAGSFTEKMRITQSGNVGIGTTTPTNGKLEIQTNETTAGLWVQTGGTTSGHVIADFRTGTNLSALQILGNGNATFGSTVDANNGFGTVVAYVNQGTTTINCDLASSLSDGTYLINAVMVRGGGGINQTYSATWLYHHYSSTAGSDVISTLVASNSPNNNNGLISLTGTTVCIGWGGSRGPASLTAMRIRFAP
jgi:hypothetical protein